MARITRRTLLAGTALLGSAAAATAVFKFWLPEKELRTRVITPKNVRRFDRTLQIDFGKVWFGNVSIGLRKQDSGSRLTLRLAEKVGDNAKVDRTPPGTVRYHEVETVAAAGDYSPPLTPADLRGMDEIGRPVMPLRYLEIDGLGDDFPIENIELHAVVSDAFTPVGDITFEGPGEAATQLNRLTELGAHTMEATSFMGIFVDGDRERLPYEADGYINQLGWYATTGDWTVPRRTIEALLVKPTWPSEWMIHLIFMVWADYIATGDKTYLASVIDRLRVFSLIDFIDQTGLVTTQNEALAKEFVAETGADYLEDIVDWPQNERDSYEMVPYNTVVNAFVYEGQRLLGLMHTALGRDEDAALNIATAEALREAIQSQLIDPRTGVYVDGLNSQHMSAHASFVPLAFGLVPSENIAATVNHLKSRIAAYDGGFPCSVYGAQYLLEGLFRADAAETAIELMLNTSIRGWLNMLDTHDATIAHEAWDPAFKENIDWTHAWGAAFHNISQRYLLGATASSPGWATWSLRPVDAFGLSMQAKIPTPHGLIEISVDAESRAVTIQSPKSAVLDEKGLTDGGLWKIEALTYYE